MTMQAEKTRKTGTEIAPAERGGIADPARLAMYEERIRLYKEQIGTGYIGIGRTLNEAKAAGVVPHGEWEDWVRRTTGLEPRQAQRCMQAATEIREGSQMARLEMSKALMLLSSGLDAETREEVAGRAAEEGTTVRQLKEEIARIRKAQADADAENTATVRALRKQVLQESGAAAEIRVELKKTMNEREDLKNQLKATVAAYQKRLDDEADAAYKQGMRDEREEARKDIRKEFQGKMDHINRERQAADERIRELQAKLEEAQQAGSRTWDEGFQAAQEEMNALRADAERNRQDAERMKGELAAAEAREEKRAAELADLKRARNQAGMDAARGIGVRAVGALDLTAAVREFIGRAGVLPQMGSLISGMSAKERETLLANVETVGKWVSDSLAALGVMRADARIQ